jgi:hypothetical protein
VDTGGPLIHSPAVQDAIATRVSDVIDKQVNVEEILNNVFASTITDRPRLQKLVGPLSGAIDGLVDSQVNSSSPRRRSPTFGSRSTPGCSRPWSGS